VADEDEAPERETPAEQAEPSPSARDLIGIGDKDAIFDALWSRVLEAWDDDRPHAALLEHSLKNEKLPELAGRYRALKDDPEKGARAQKKIDGIVIAATQMLMSMKTPVRTKLPWQWSAAAGLTFVIIFAWLFYTLFIPHHR
jgi:hypothetical protein